LRWGAFRPHCAAQRPAQLDDKLLVAVTFGAAQLMIHMSDHQRACAAGQQRPQQADAIRPTRNGDRHAASARTKRLQRFPNAVEEWPIDFHGYTLRLTW
jgi:hypothetical protein